jgi:hypothetical protein
MKHPLFASVVLLSLSSSAFCAEPQNNQPDSTVEKPAQSNSAPQQNSNQPVYKKITDNTKAPEQQSIANFCRTHTC